MDIILMADVDNLGQMGQVVSVARGYARNFLIPQGLAALATPGAHKVVEEKMRLNQTRDLKRKADAEKLAAELPEISCTISVQADDDEKLFGSVTSRDIATALDDQEYDYDYKQIELEEPIKQLGVYNVPLKLHAEVAITIKVWVVKA